jgi:predicted transcriptional regulator
MSTPIINIDVGKSVEGAAAILNKYKINRLPVVHDSSIIGILITGIIIAMFQLKNMLRMSSEHFLLILMTFRH